MKTPLRLIVICSIGAVIGIGGYLSRYQYIMTEAGTYRVNRWTGDTELLVRNRILPMLREESLPPNPVSLARDRWPGLKDWDDERIIKNLDLPDRFRAAFPEYSRVSDETIHLYMQRFKERRALEGGSPPSWAP